MQHVDLEGPEGDALLIEIVPSTPQLPRLIPNLLDQGIVLNDNRVLHKGPGRRWSIASIIIRRARHPTSVQVNVKGRAQVT